MIRLNVKVCIASGAACGAAVSSGFVVGLSFAGLFPLVALAQTNRRRAYGTALSYYGCVAWPVIPVCRNYFGSGLGIAVGILFWALASCFLALPWLWAWHIRPSAALWRTPVAMLLSVFPPLGILGWAHPFVAAGVLFPGTHWWGLGMMTLLPGLLIKWPRPTAVATVAGIVFTNLCFPVTPASPLGWQVVNTEYGDIAASLTAQHSASLQLCNDVRAATDAVIVFPEGSIPNWSPAHAKELQESLAHSRARVILLGAQIQDPFGGDGTSAVSGVDRALQILRDNAEGGMPLRRPGGRRYRNVLMAVTAEGVQAFDQHVPVPIAMWRPYGAGGVPMHWSRNRSVEFAQQRVCVLICYETLICWPMLSAMVDRPNILLAIANDHWSRHSTIPSFQLGVMWSWSRLFQTSFLRAANL